MGEFGRIREFGSIWESFGLLGRMWESLREFRNVSERLRVCRRVLKCLSAFWNVRLGECEKDWERLGELGESGRV